MMMASLMMPSLSTAMLAFALLFRMPSLGTALQNGLALTPPRGFSTWQQWPDPMGGTTGGPAWVNPITEKLARQYMNGLVAHGLNKLNYTYFIIDEPCFTGRDASGTLLENKTTWPNGLKSFGAELRSHGMKLGIYTCVGPKTCGGCMASEGHEDQDMQTFADWGAEYVKVSNCFCSVSWHVGKV
jgi:alpha-galactosidase